MPAGTQRWNASAGAPGPADGPADGLANSRDNGRDAGAVTPPDLPTGTVTRFTAVEGSTRAITEQHSANVEALGELRRILRAVVAAHDLDVERLGDAFLLEFR